MVRCSAITGDIFARHEIETHDESSARLDAACSGLPEGISIIEPGIAAEEDILRVHTHSHVNMIREFSSHGGQHFIDQSTYVNSESFEVASFAAGATIEAVQRSIDGEHCFALVRPPGHHAEPDRAMGFCIFNNVALGLALAGVDAATGGSSHVTRALGGGPTALAKDVGDRLELSWRRTVESPGPLAVVLGALTLLALVATRRPRTPVTDALLVALAVSLVVNDTPSDVLGIGAAAAIALHRFERTTSGGAL